MITVPMNKDFERALYYLKKKVRISERDRVNLTKLLQRAIEEDEPSPDNDFEENTQQWLASKKTRNNAGRHPR
jgi:hypothetical protein